jgi:hypothetical protein
MNNSLLAEYVLDPRKGFIRAQNFVYYIKIVEEFAVISLGKKAIPIHLSAFHRESIHLLLGLFISWQNL